MEYGNMVSYIPWKYSISIYTKAANPRQMELIFREGELLTEFIWGVSLRKVCMGAVCFLMALCLILANPSTAVNAATTPAIAEERLNTKVISAYVYDRGDLQFRDEDAGYLSQINYSFALIKDGQVTGNHWAAIDTFEEYIDKHPNIIPVMAIGGWGADGFSQAASTAEGRKTFVQSAMELMDKHGFLGIDIDWEYPGSSVAGIASSPEDNDNLILLLKELRTALDAKTEQDGKKRILTIAVGGSKEYADKLDCVTIASLVDQVNIMTYDLMGGEKTTGHHTALYPSNAESPSGDAAIQAFIEAGVPSEKIMLGAAFYGRAWRQVETEEQNGLHQSAGTSGNKSYAYPDIIDLLSDGYTRYWDESASAPYLFNGNTFVSYEDTESIALKGTYANDNGLQGVMFWEYGQDKTGELLKALFSAME